MYFYARWHNWEAGCMHSKFLGSKMYSMCPGAPGQNIFIYFLIQMLVWVNKHLPITVELNMNKGIQIPVQMPVRKK